MMRMPSSVGPATCRINPLGVGPAIVAQVLPELQRLMIEQPLRERLHALAMLAFYRCGRQTEALDLYAELRSRLREQLGLEPARELRELQRRILQHDDTLTAAATKEPSAWALPVPPNQLLGREREVEELRSLLLQEDVRLLTLSGAGGSGKTRLALEVAIEVAGAFANGAVFVGLAPLRDAALVPAAIAGALAIPQAAGEPPAETLARSLRPRELLLLLDNAEHVRAAAPLFADLLAHAPRLRIVVTSRAVLHLSGEHVYPVQPLGTDAALTLFLERARDADPHFHADAPAEAAIRDICKRLDSLPLAIELAAAHVRALTPPELLARLEPRLPLLAGGPHDLPARQQTLRATLEWSYNLLGADAQRDLRALSVFAVAARSRRPRVSARQHSSGLRPCSTTTCSTVRRHRMAPATRCSKRSASTRSSNWRRHRRAPTSNSATPSSSSVLLTARTSTPASSRPAVSTSRSRTPNRTTSAPRWLGP
jgi:hypothetical protein